MEKLVVGPRKGRVDKHERKRARSTSFSGSLPPHEQTRQAGTRRASVVAPVGTKLSSHHSGIPLPAWRDNVQDYPWPHLPGKAVGYSRSWMQDNPWPELQMKPSSSKRSFFHGRSHKEGESRLQELPSMVPGGSVFDPLNLRAIALGEELPGTAPSTPEPETNRFDMPANNFIPLNTSDPLGLLKDVDDTSPLFLKYDPSKAKRKRGKAKRKEANDVSVGKGSGGRMLEAVSASHSSGTNSASAVTTAAQVFSTATASSTPSLQFATDSALPSHLNPSGRSQSTLVSEGSSDAGAVPMETSDSAAMSTVSSEQQVCEDIRTEGEGASAAEEITESGHSLESTLHSAPAGEEGVHRPTSSLACLQQADGNKPLQRKTLFYPVPMSPLDEHEKMQVARNRRSLRKALRIEPLGPEETKKVIREEERKHREFKRLWRYPNLKSPEDRDEKSSSPSPQVEALQIDTSLTPEKFASLLHGPPSRTVDSIISPMLRPHPSQIRRRRRTISECSSRDSATLASKALNFELSVSPEAPVPQSQVTPKKRRSSSKGEGTSALVPQAQGTPKKQRRLSSRGECPSAPVPQSQSTPKKQRRLSSRSERSQWKRKSDLKPATATIKFAKNAAYKHGNYYRYYGYRTPEVPDFRLYYFRREWFEGKDVLDIGCNAGDVTLAVAQLFHPQKIVGMDIDPNLIRIARQNIRSHQTKANMHQMEKYPVSTNQYGPIEPLPALTNPSNLFPKNIMFMQGNYILDRDEQLNYVREEYDLILALSVTKWIHLNHGDEGLKRAFNRMFQQLRPGGRLILEPQPWPSYRRRKKLSPTIYKNYNSIKLKPDRFSEYLINTVGFCKREFLGMPFNPSKGFQRPLFLFTKYKEASDSTPQGSGDGFVNPLPRPPPLYSISERIAFLAGYSAHSGSTPGQATPGGLAEASGVVAPRYGPVAHSDWGIARPCPLGPSRLPESPTAATSTASQRSSPSSARLCSSSSESVDSWSFAGDGEDGAAGLSGGRFYLPGNHLSGDSSHQSGDNAISSDSLHLSGDSSHLQGDSSHLSPENRQVVTSSQRPHAALVNGALVSDGESPTMNGVSPLAEAPDDALPLVDDAPDSVSPLAEEAMHEDVAPFVDGPLTEAAHEYLPWAEAEALAEAVNEPSPLVDNVNEPFPLAEAVDEPSPLVDNVNEPSSLAEAVNERSPLVDNVNEPFPLAEAVNEPSPLVDNVSEPFPLAEAVDEPSPLVDNISEPFSLAETMNEPSPPSMDAVDEPSLLVETVRELSPLLETVHEPSPLVETNDEPSPLVETVDEPSPSVETVHEPSLLVETSAEPSPLVETVHAPSPLVEAVDEPSRLVETVHGPSPLVEADDEPSPLVRTADEPSPSVEMMR